MSRFSTVPAAVTPANANDADLRVARTRQATFERGVALALVSTMLSEMRQLTSLSTGLRWLYAEEDAAAVKSWLQNLHGDLLRAERIEERADRE